MRMASPPQRLITPSPACSHQQRASSHLSLRDTKNTLVYFRYSRDIFIDKSARVSVPDATFTVPGLFLIPRATTGFSTISPLVMQSTVLIFTTIYVRIGFRNAYFSVRGMFEIDFQCRKWS